MVVDLVVAASDNDVIGRRNSLPWRLPADLRHFRSLTLDKAVLMGRKTFESIGKALPRRTNIVLSRRASFRAAGCQVARDVPEACRIAGDGPLMVIGGAEIYRQFLPLARRIHLTLVHTHIEDGDAFFSDWRAEDWREIDRERHDGDGESGHAFSFVTLERSRASVAG